MIEQTKITLKMSAKLWESFDARIRSLPVKRDQYLTSVIATETPKLAQAMKGRRLSAKARGHISATLASRQTRTVNVGIDKAVASSLNEVIEQSNMVRDAFMNRLILFLQPNDELLKFLGISRREQTWPVKSFGTEALKPTSPLAALEEAFDDPLWYLHEAVEHVHETSLYLIGFADPKMDFLSCWMDDAAVPGTRAHKRHEREMAKLMDGLVDLNFGPSGDSVGG